MAFNVFSVFEPNTAVRGWGEKEEEYWKIYLKLDKVNPLRVYTMVEWTLM